MVTESSKKRLFDTIKLLFFLLSILFFYYLLRHIGFDKIGQTFRHIGIYGASILLIAGLFENVFDAASLQYATPQRTVLWKILSINSVGGLMNTLLPWDMGEVIKGALIKKHASLKDSVTGVVLYNLIFKLSKPLVIFGAILVVFLFPSEHDWTLLLLLLGASFLSFIPFFFISLMLKFSLTTHLFSLLSRFSKRDYRAFLAKTRSFEIGLEQFRRERSGDYYRVLLLQIFARVVSLITFLIVARLLESEYSFEILLIANAYINLANYIAMLIPAKLGVTEGTSYLVFSMLGLDGGIGVMIALVLRIKALFTMTLSSILLLFI